MLHSLLIWYLERNYVIKQAKSESERQAIFEFRYNIYVQEMKKKTQKNLPKDYNEIRDNEDDLEDSDLFYVTSKKSNQPLATFRLQRFTLSDPNNKIVGRYSLSRYPEFKHKKLVEMSRLMLHKSINQKKLMLVISAFIYKYCSTLSIDAGFLYCAPLLSKYYRQFGYRQYSASLLQSNDGIRLPMINFFADYNFYQNVNSPLQHLAKRYASTNPIQPSLSFQEDDLFTLSQEQLRKSAINSILSDNIQCEFFKGLSEDELNQIFDYGSLIKVREKDVILTQGLAEKEVYIILSGEIESIHQSKKGSQVSELKAGGVFGEVAFFVYKGKRSASIIAKSPCSLLLLSRSVLKRLSNENPSLALKILNNLGTVLSKKLLILNSR